MAPPKEQSEATQVTMQSALAVGSDVVPSFGKRFLTDHAGKIIAKPLVALVEIVANAWDAGARRVEVEWPDAVGGEIRVIDDGVGLTASEFQNRWTRMNYNRLGNQGTDVVFPPGVSASPRKAWGRNGKGRHAMFAFDDSYTVLARKDGEQSTWEVKRVDEAHAPFVVKLLAEGSSDSTGLELRGKVKRNHLPAKDIADWVGARFLADPEFSVAINGNEISLARLDDYVVETKTLEVNGHTIAIQCIDGKSAGRTMQQSGIAWWVNGRRVGPVGWSIRDQVLVDGRSHLGKRYTLIVHVNHLAEYVAADWSGFLEEPEVDQTKERVAQEIGEMVKDLAGSTRREQKLEIVKRHREDIRQLSYFSQDVVGDFLDEVQQLAPTIRKVDLEHATQVMISLEGSRHGARLLEQLADLAEGDLNALSDILDSWSVREAQIVLDELGARLQLIGELEQLAEHPTTKELQQLQPLLERGLWIFGPEFESIHYTSNKTLATVMAGLFKSKGAKVESPAKRPDFVVLPDSGIAYSAYSCDSFENGEADEISRVLVLELKRGGSTIGADEMNQARGYVRALRNSGKVPAAATITAFVLGARVDDEKLVQGNDTLTPQTYERIINRAKARTFRLKERIEEHARTTDPEIREALMQQSVVAHGSEETT